MTTTQAAVKAALKTALLARTFIVNNHVPVSYGEPGDEGRSEQIWIGTAFNEADQEPRDFSVGHRLEEYVVKVYAENASQPTPEKAEARVVLIVAEVEQVVIDNPKLDVAGVRFIRPAGVSLKTTEGGDLARSIATVTLAVTARLT